jgi:tetratricopeptide (TPR) repeat protein
MKLICLLLTLIGSSFAASIDLPMTTNGGSISYAPKVGNRRGELQAPTSIFDLEELNRALFSEARKQGDELKRVKFLLINGELKLASVYLNKLAYTQTKLRPIIFRYLALISFIDGEFQKSFEYLTKPELAPAVHFAKVCSLRSLNQIILGHILDLDDVWSRCKEENSNHFKESNLVWLDTLVALKLNPRPGITKVPFKRLKLAALNNEELKMFLKLALYLNQEKLLTSEILELTPDQLQDTEVREIAGQLLFRTGALAKSYRFIEDLNSPNAENIKGNLYVLRNKYEIAYAQFKLALEQKQNSQNALERLIPLAWLLGDWEGGVGYAERIIALPETKVNKLTLLAALFMQKGDFERSQLILEEIARKSRRGGELDVTQLASFVFLMQNKTFQAKRFADQSCTQYDLVNCWLLFQIDQWEAFSLTMRREEKITHNKTWEKLTKEVKHEPIVEKSYINQQDIEEMDDKLINLIPKSP